MWLRVVSIFKRDSVDEVHHVGYRRLTTGEFQLVDKWGFWDAYEVTVLEQPFKTEDEAIAAFKGRIEELDRKVLFSNFKACGTSNASYKFRAVIDLKGF